MVSAPDTRVHALAGALRCVLKQLCLCSAPLHPRCINGYPWIVGSTWMCQKFWHIVHLKLIFFNTYSFHPSPLIHAPSPPAAYQHCSLFREVLHCNHTTLDGGREGGIFVEFSLFYKGVNIMAKKENAMSSQCVNYFCTYRCIPPGGGGGGGSSTSPGRFMLKKLE